MAEEVPRRMKRFYRKGEMLPSENILPVQEKTTLDKDSLFGKSNVPEKNFEEEEDEMAQDLAEESSEELMAEKPKKPIFDDKEEIINELGKKSEEDVHEELAKQELDKFKQKFKRLPESEQDYNAIAEAIFEQIQLKGEGQAFGEKPAEEYSNAEPEEKAEDKSKRKIRRRGRQQQEQPEEQQAKSPAIQEEPQAKGSVSDLFETSAAKKPKKKTSELDEDLGESDDLESFDEESDESEEGIDDLGSMEESESMESDLENLDEDKEECPNCEKQTDEVIYCSSCGAAFCDSCAKSKEKFTDKIKYTCPHCGVKIDKAIKK